LVRPPHIVLPFTLTTVRVSGKTGFVADCLCPVEKRRWEPYMFPYRGMRGRGITMPDVTIVYWRDIPAQVIVGKGRRGAKRPLEERFEQAIDRAAMKVNARDADAYLAEWRKADPYAVEGDPTEIVESEAKRLETEFDDAKLKTLIANDGWA